MSQSTIDKLNDFLNPEKNHSYGLMDLNCKTMLLFARQELERLQASAHEARQADAELALLKAENDQLRKKADDLTQALINACSLRSLPPTQIPYYPPNIHKFWWSDTTANPKLDSI